MRLRYWEVPREVTVGDLVMSHSLILVVDDLGDEELGWLPKAIEPFDQVMIFKNKVEIGESV